MIPTAVIIAIAVESAPTSTEVRRSDADKLCDASDASTPRIAPRARVSIRVVKIHHRRNRQRRRRNHQQRREISEERFARDGWRARSRERTNRERHRNHEIAQLVHPRQVLASPARHRFDRRNERRLPRRRVRRRNRNADSNNQRQRD